MCRDGAIEGDLVHSTDIFTQEDSLNFISLFLSLLDDFAQIKERKEKEEIEELVKAEVGLEEVARYSVAKRKWGGLEEVGVKREKSENM